jgi:hypothetical protein
VPQIYSSGRPISYCKPNRERNDIMKVNYLYVQVATAVKAMGEYCSRVLDVIQIIIHNSYFNYVSKIVFLVWVLFLPSKFQPLYIVILTWEQPFSRVKYWYCSACIN